MNFGNHDGRGLQPNNFAKKFSPYHIFILSCFHFSFITKNKANLTNLERQTSTNETFYSQCRSNSSFKKSLEPHSSNEVELGSSWQRKQSVFDQTEQLGQDIANMGHMCCAEYDLSSQILSYLYWGIFCISLMIFLQLGPIHSHWTWQKIFHVFVMAGTLGIVDSLSIFND